jgi:flagellar basal-body rod protein FlgB
MDAQEVISGRLIGRSMRLLKSSLDFRAANQSVIAGNIANIETPGYEPKKASFSQALKKAVDGRAAEIQGDLNLFRTHQSHLPASPPANTPYTIVSAERGAAYLDREMAEMAKNNLLFEASATLLAKKFQGLRTAIEGRGR